LLLLLLLLFCKTRSLDVSQAELELKNLCLSFPGVQITGLYHRAWFAIKFLTNFERNTKYDSCFNFWNFFFMFVKVINLFFLNAISEELAFYIILSY
jgi:hypothetical protein